MDAIAAPTTRRLDSPLHAVGTASPEPARTLEVAAEYRLSEAGRKASLLGGGDGRTEQRVTLTLPITRLHLVHVDGRGVARLKLRPQFTLNDDQRVMKITFAPVYDVPPTLDDLLRDAARNHELERTYHAQRSARQSARRQTLDEWRTQVATEFLHDPQRRAVTWPAPTPRRCQIMTPRGALHFDARRDPGLAKQVPLEAFRRFDADVRIRHAQGAELRARFDATHAERLQAMGAWIAQHGTPDQQQRLDAGMLPFEEFLEALTDVTFRSLGFLEPYRLDGAARLQAFLRTHPTLADASVGPSELHVRTRLLSSASPVQWAVLQRIRSLVPEAISQLRERSLAWTRDPRAPKLLLPTVLATMTVGTLRLRREFHIPAVAPDAPARSKEDDSDR